MNANQLTQVCAICLRDISGTNAIPISSQHDNLCYECGRHADIAKMINDHMQLTQFKAPFKVHIRNGNNVAWCPNCTANATVLTSNSAGATQIMCSKCGIRISILPDGELIVEDLRTHSQIYLNNTPLAFDNALTGGEWYNKTLRELGMGTYSGYHGSQNEPHVSDTVVDCVQSKISLIKKLLKGS